MTHFIIILYVHLYLPPCECREFHNLKFESDFSNLVVIENYIWNSSRSNSIYKWKLFDNMHIIES